MASLTERMIGAAKLDVATYEEVENDPTAMGQAMLVVVLSSVAAGIGTIGMIGIRGLVIGTIVAIVGWFLWAGLTFLIGTKLLPEPETRADFGQLLRSIGFSASPGVLRILGIIPILGWLISLAASIWMLVAMVIAVRQALDYKSTGRAVGVCLIGFVVYLVFAAIVGGMTGLAMSG
ncbi:MAG TPA: YIP1 family protein [Acidobacteriota bacterium]